jgi:hypothetical protein
MLFIVYFMYLEVRLFLKSKREYWSRFWSYVEAGIIACSWASVGIHIWRYRQCQHIGRLFRETNGYAYINIQFISYINDLLTYLLGFCCFFGTVKAIRLCRFSRRLCLFSQTLQYASTALLSFSLMFSIVFASFLCLFYLLFVSKLPSCASLLETSQMLFEMMLMKFDAQQLTGAAAFLGPFSFSLFMFLVVFVCMSMFLSIINENFHRARENVNGEPQVMFSFMIRRFQRWAGIGIQLRENGLPITEESLLGLGERNEEEIQAERDDVMRSEYHEPIERFPKKVDQLIDALNRVGGFLLGN